MRPSVRSLISLLLVLSTVASPAMGVASVQDNQQKATPLNLDGASQPRHGKTLEFDAEDRDGNPIHTTGQWATLTDAELYETPVLNGLQNNDPTDPIPIFTLASHRAEAEAFRDELATKKNIAADLVVIDEEDQAFVQQAEHEIELNGDDRVSNFGGGAEIIPPLSTADLQTKRASITPTVQEKTLGNIQSFFQFGASSFIYFSVGIDPVSASAIVLLRTLITRHWAVNARKVDDYFNKGLDLENHPNRSRALNLFRRFVVDIGIGETTRAISGAYGHVHSVLSWAGQGEIWKNVMVAAATSYILLYSRLKTFPNEEDRYAIPIIGFCSFFPATVINLLDFSKMDIGPIKLSHVVTHIGNFDITLTNLILLGGYSTAALTIHFFRPQTLAFARWGSRSLEKLVKKTSTVYDKLKNQVLECRDSLRNL